MKILMNGATSGTNFGDYLFAEMFHKKIAEIVGIDNVFWYKSRYALSEFFLKNLKYDKKYKLYEINALIYISGGYFYGDDKGWRDYLRRYLRYFHIGIRCIVRKIPLGIFAVEIGPTPCKLLEVIERKILNNAKVIIVRNRESEKYAKKILKRETHTKIICTSDSVFAIDDSFFRDMPAPSEIIACKSKKIFFHINPTINSNDELIKKIIPCLNAFCERHKDYTIVVGADQYSVTQKEAFERVRTHLIAPNVIFCEYNNPMVLCKVLSICDFIVTHKLHVGIFGAYSGKSVVSFSGHTGKIERLYNQLNIPERTTPISSLTLDKGLGLLERFHSIPIHLSEDITNSAKLNFKILTDFISQL